MNLHRSYDRKNYSALDAALKSIPPRLREGHLEFLIYNRVALRFQHTAYDEAMARDGQIKGDAYSLSYPKEWHPASDYKARDFQNELNHLIKCIIVREIISRSSQAGTFMLLKDVERAHAPVTDKLYGPPFYPVGALTTFLAGQAIGAAAVTPEMVATACPPAPARQWADADVDRLTAGLTNQLVSQIVAASDAGQERTASLKAASLERVNKTAQMQRMAGMFR